MSLHARQHAAELVRLRAQRDALRAALDDVLDTYSALCRLEVEMRPRLLARHREALGDLLSSPTWDDARAARAQTREA
jgi:Spy/CpxP family protein refolding chaperone